MTQYLIFDGVSNTCGVCHNLDEAMTIVKEMPHLMIIPFDTKKIMAYHPTKEKIIQGKTEINQIAVDVLQNIVDNMRSKNEEKDNHQDQE